MKKVLIIHAHPESNSFCSSLMNEAVLHFNSLGSEVRVTDLYQSQFNPVGGKHDFKELKNSDYFKYQLEQVNAYNQDLFIDDLKHEMENLVWCDLLLFSFPLWWFSMPAILKGWVDRVFAMGLVYGNGKGVYKNGTYSHKTAMILMTTGGPETTYNGGSNGNLDTILFPIQHGIFYFTGMTVLPPFVCFSPARKTESELELELERFKTHLQNVQLQKPIYTNLT